MPIFPPDQKYDLPDDKSGGISFTSLQVTGRTRSAYCWPANQRCRGMACECSFEDFLIAISNLTPEQEDQLCNTFPCSGGGPISIVVDDTLTLTLTGNGTASTPVVGEVVLDPDSNNALEVTPQGLNVPNASLASDGEGTLTFTDNQGASSTIDLLDAFTDAFGQPIG